jgi:hypothetical protein
MRKNSINNTRLWCAMRVMQRFNLKQLSQQAGVGYQNTVYYCALLNKHQYLQKEKDASDNTIRPLIYRLLLDTGPGAPLGDRNRLEDPNLASEISDRRQRIWVVIMASKIFKVAQIEAIAKVKKQFTQNYVLQLRRAGYIVMLRHSGGDSYGATYELVNPTGPQAPLPEPGGSIFDPNEFLQTLQKEISNARTEQRTRRRFSHH